MENNFIELLTKDEKIRLGFYERFGSDAENAYSFVMMRKLDGCAADAVPLAGGPDANGHEYVDLGLPSGRLWATCNVGAENPEDFGLVFAWGETKGFDGQGEFPHEYNWDWYDEQSFSRVDLDDDITPDSGFDAARENMGGDWRMPTKEEFQELYDNTTCVWATIGGVNGHKFTSKKDSSKYIFFPAAGNLHGTNWNNRGSNGYYWSSSRYSSDYAYYLNFGSGGVYPQNGNYRYYGFSVRGVL